MAFDQASELLARLARLIAADGYSSQLQPVQWQALRFLAVANRFSRTPSGLTAWLGQTKGSVSQTINALVRKGLVMRTGDAADRRVVRLALTDAGKHAVVSATPVAGEILAALDEEDRAIFGKLIGKSLRNAIAARGGRAFGVCRDCAHFEAGQEGRNRCALLNEALSDDDGAKICIEQVAA